MKFGRYQIVRPIGKGSMGVVYEAHDPRIDRRVALKVLRTDRLASEDFVERFLREARAVGRLSHPNIVTVHDSGQDNDTLFIVMELLTGKTLAEVQRERRLELQEIVRIGTQVAEALEYAHRHGIVHRDVKPSNILLGRGSDDPVKLTDFGIARLEDPGDLHRTLAGDILGTPVYMSPEQVSGSAVDSRTDLYSLGVILYEMAAGGRAFQGKSMAEVFRAIVESDPPPPGLPDTPVGRRLGELILKSMRKPPAERFQTGHEMAQALKGCLQRRQSDVQSPHPAPPAARKRRPRLGRRLASAAALLLLAGAILLFYSGWAPEPPANTAREPQPGAPVRAGLPPQPLQTARLDLVSDPPGAEVFIDGNLKGPTPLLLDLALGSYEVRLQAPNHFDWEGQLQLDREGPVPLRVQLVPMAEKKPGT
jgi:serine/threonine-protein kinase